MPKFEVPDGWTVQAFRFTLDPTEDQAKALARHFGARRKAYNWTVATLKSRHPGVACQRDRDSETVAARAAQTLEHRQGRRVRQHRDRCRVVA